MSSRRERRKAWEPDKLDTLPITGKTIERKRKSLLRKIKSAIKDEERASRIYSALSAEAKLVNTEISSEIYALSGEEYVHKTKLEEMYRKLGGIIK